MSVGEIMNLKKFFAVPVQFKDKLDVEWADNFVVALLLLAVKMTRIFLLRVRKYLLYCSKILKNTYFRFLKKRIADQITPELLVIERVNVIKSMDRLQRLVYR